MSWWSVILLKPLLMLMSLVLLVNLLFARHPYCCWAFLPVSLHLLAIMLLLVPLLFLRPYFCWHPWCYWQPLFAGTLKASPLLPVSLLLLESLSVAGTSLFLVPPSWHTSCCWSPLCAIAGIPIFLKYRNRLVFYLIYHYFWHCAFRISNNGPQKSSPNIGLEHQFMEPMDIGLQLVNCPALLMKIKL